MFLAKGPAGGRAMRTKWDGVLKNGPNGALKNSLVDCSSERASLRIGVDVFPSAERASSEGAFRFVI